MPKSNRTKEERIQSLYKNFTSYQERNDKIVFNFQFLTSGDKYGQSFEDWDRERIILDLTQRLKEFSSKTKTQLLNEGTLAIYEDFPMHSLFMYPRSLPQIPELKWARLVLTGKRRLVGFFNSGSSADSNTFFVVFLDKDHQFYPVEKRHT